METFITNVLDKYGIWGLAIVGLFVALWFQSRTFAKMVDNIGTANQSLTTQIAGGIGGLREDLRDDRQTLSNHNEQSIQRQAAVLLSIDKVGAWIGENTATLRELVRMMNEVKTSTDQAAASQIAIVSALGEMKKTMETNSTQEVTTQEKLDRILALLEEMKKEWQQTTSQFKARLESVEADVRAVKAENGKPPENTPTIDKQEKSNDTRITASE